MSQISPYISHSVNIADVQDLEVAGSASAAANQVFTVNLSSYGAQIGDRVTITGFGVRGDLSGDTEFLDVGFTLPSNSKTRLGESDEFQDDDIYRGGEDLSSVEFNVFNIGSGVPGFSVFVSPSTPVNFSPSGLPSGWWWQLRLSFKIFRY